MLPTINICGIYQDRRAPFILGKQMPQELPRDVNFNYILLVDGVYYDLCVICKTNTGVPTEISIEQRSYYIEGCGQLCEDCWNQAEFIT